MTIRQVRGLGHPVAQGMPSSVGIDWITATEKVTKSRGRLWTEGHGLIEAEESLGNEKRDWRWRDFRGVTCGSVSVGQRPGLALVQCRSDLASEMWKPLFLRATNVSRLDLQITWSINPPNPQCFARAKYNADALNKTASHPITVSLITSQQTGDTLYLGRRASPIYGRFYDKGAEDGSDIHGALLRQELELKKDCALETAKFLLGQEDEGLSIAGLVDNYFTSKGVQVRNIDSGCSWESLLIARAAQVNAGELPIRWLHSSVRPIIEKFIAAGRLPEAIEALGLSEKVLILNLDDGPVE